jgi:hypothetical protein
MRTSRIGMSARKVLELSLKEHQILNDARDLCQKIRDEEAKHFGPDELTSATSAWAGLTQLLDDLADRGGIDLE